jgi:homoserine O-acetyltransferase/O-succinyltransferase
MITHHDNFVRAIAVIAFAMVSLPAMAAEYPAPKEGTWVTKDFKFHTGEVLPELRVHYRTVGEPTGAPVLMLHGTGGSGANSLNPNFAGELFGPGQPLDATKHFIILPDAIGAGRSSKPSDGLRNNFPKYNYDDMVTAQYRLLTEGLGIRHLRVIVGTSGGGMQTWVWGEKYPDFMDALVPLASQPTEISARNWMTRRMMIETIRADPEWNNGNYTAQPRNLKIALVAFGIATSGGTLNYQRIAPTRERADKVVDDRLAARSNADANDVIYQYEASRDYNPAPGLDRIQAALLAVNSADDERNPPETGLMEREIKRVKNGRMYLIPAGPDSRGHGTTGFAKLWKQQLDDLLKATPPRPM